MALPYYANGTRELRVSSPMMTGTDVEFVQKFIGSRCGPADGIFGNQTAEGVRWYQGMRGIAVTGVVDATTWSHMLGRPVTIGQSTPSPLPPNGLAGGVFSPGTPLADVGPNPIPSRITHEMWMFWAAFKALEPSVLLGGIFANKPGYHNARDLLPTSDYSVGQFAADREGPGWAAAAIDLTFPDAQAKSYATIAKYSDRLLRSGLDMNDERGNYLREFYGQADGDLEVEGWDFQRLIRVTSDSSHLWHIHISILRKHLQDAKAFRALLSILQGEPVQVWRDRESALLAPPEPEPVPGPTPELEPDEELDRKAEAVLALLRPYAADIDKALAAVGAALEGLVAAVEPLGDLTEDQIREVIK